MESYAIIIYSFQPITIFAKLSMLDVCRGASCASAYNIKLLIIRLSKVLGLTVVTLGYSLKT